MFCDEANIYIKAGDGGKGCASMRREKYVPKGGPDGGDGGRGGAIIFIADHNENTLTNYRSAYRFVAENGGMGKGKLQHGKYGEDKVLKVPVGTIVKDKYTEKILCDLDEHGKSATILEGGKGGFGNSHFKSSTYKAPKFAEKGEPGQDKEVTLELKIVADVAIIGYPSVGKSTFISVVSNSKPKIADYPFTTLVPNLGVAKIHSDSFLIADIPGLIDGAADGKGLGNQFLRHIERCKTVVHMLDCTRSNIVDDYLNIRNELKTYSKTISKKKEIIAINKTDTLDDELLRILIDDFKAGAKKGPRTKVFNISSISKQNLNPLLEEMSKNIQKVNLRKEKVVQKIEDSKVYTPHLDMEREGWLLEERDGKYILTGKRIEQIVSMTDWGNREAIYHLKDVLKKKKIFDAMKKKGFNYGDTFYIGDVDLTKLYPQMQ